jgi:hypothetical protein
MPRIIGKKFELRISKFNVSPGSFRDSAFEMLPLYLVPAGAQLTRFFEKKIGGNQVSFRVASEDNPKAFTNDDNRFPRKP